MKDILIVIILILVCVLAGVVWGFISAFKFLKKQIVSLIELIGMVDIYGLTKEKKNESK